MYSCEICGKQLKSAAGLSGHKQIAHAAIAKPNVPDDHVLAEAVESALDNMGELRELLDSQLPKIVVELKANWEAVSVKLDGFQRSLNPPNGHDAPSLALISAWESCSSCGPKWIELKGVLKQRWHEEELAAVQALAKHSGDETPERSDQVEAVQSQRWLIVLPGPKSGFKWMDRGDNCPGLPAGNSKVEGYCRVVEDEAEVEKFRGKSGIEVIELGPVEAPVS